VGLSGVLELLEIRLERYYALNDMSSHVDILLKDMGKSPNNVGLEVVQGNAPGC
jgi:hypothetical protein